MEKFKKQGKIVLAFENEEGQLKKIHTSDIEESMFNDLIFFMEYDKKIEIEYFHEDLDVIDILEYKFINSNENKEDCSIEWEKTEKMMNDILNTTDPIRSEANKLLNDLDNSINNC